MLVMPKNILNHSMSSICGTFSLVHTADISELRSAMGPVRCVSERHSQRIVKFLHDSSGWVSQYKTLIGKEAPRSQLTEEQKLQVDGKVKEMREAGASRQEIRKQINAKV